MSHRFRLIVFDFDGTLADSQRMIVRAMSDGFAANDMAPPGAEVIKRVVGLSLEQAVARLLPDLDDTALFGRIAESYRQAFFSLRQNPGYHEPLYPDAREVLAVLDSETVCLGIATGKSRRGLLACLNLHGLEDRFMTLQTADMAAGKPDPEMLHRAMADAGAQPDDTVFIGDTTYDMEMAGNAGVIGIGVAWGYHETAELRAGGARVIVETFGEIPAALAGL